MNEKEQIDMMYKIIDDEYSKLCTLQDCAMKKGMWKEVYEYETKKIMIKHLTDRFTKEIVKENKGVLA